MISEQRVLKFRVWIPSEKFMGVSFDPFENGQPGETPGHWKPDSVFLQFTGLHDKNGQEIYEGDLCEHDSDGVFQVVYVPEEAQFKRLFSDGCRIQFTNRTKLYLKVIGNIYETPNLLTL